MLKMKIGESQYGEQPAGSLNNKNVNEIRTLHNYTQK